ncbi:MAG TPA: efflux RND transporter periplasmic adaptor subunit, partial [Clostridia bacterium]|nr:efflux RND transporter periplasmic adaptor subunit [Clostridia bacterium]
VDVQVKVLPKNWAVGQRAEVFIETGRKECPLALPLGFVSWRGGKAGVFVVQKGKATWQQIELGLRGLKTAEVTAGLTANDVLCKPSRLKQVLTDGQRVRAL